MPVIERLQIGNFQKHTRLSIRFTEAVTVIVGASDAGKSAVVRALRWLVTNKPGGDAFIKEGEDTCRVRAQIAGRTVERIRGKENLYKLDDETFKAFGAAPPDTVQQHLQLGEINFQGQHDAPFWLGLTAGEVAKQLNTVVDLEIVDKVFSEVRARVQKSRTRLQLLDEQVVAATVEVDELRDAQAMWDDYEKLEACYTRWHEVDEQVGVLSETIEQYTTTETTHLRLIEKKRAIDVVYAIAKRTREAEDEVAELKRLIQEVETITFWADRKIPDITRLRDCRKVFMTLVEDLGDLKEIITEVNVHMREINKTQSTLDQLNEQLKRVKRCPTCSRVL